MKKKERNFDICFVVLVDEEEVQFLERERERERWVAFLVKAKRSCFMIKFISTIEKKRRNEGELYLSTL